MNLLPAYVIDNEKVMEISFFKINGGQMK